MEDLSNWLTIPQMAEATGKSIRSIERRAQAVKAYLVSKGIAASRLSTEGKGETEPIADNTKNGRDNPEGRAMNRRAELKVQ